LILISDLFKKHSVASQYLKMKGICFFLVLYKSCINTYTEIILPRGDIWAHQASLTPPLFKCLY